jgi:hypothetical protein
MGLHFVSFVSFVLAQERIAAKGRADEHGTEHHDGT